MKRRDTFLSVQIQLLQRTNWPPELLCWASALQSSGWMKTEVCRLGWLKTPQIWAGWCVWGRGLGCLVRCLTETTGWIVLRQTEGICKARGGKNAAHGSACLAPVDVNKDSDVATFRTFSQVASFWCSISNFHQPGSTREVKWQPGTPWPPLNLSLYTHTHAHTHWALAHDSNY